MAFSQPTPTPTNLVLMYSSVEKSLGIGGGVMQKFIRACSEGDLLEAKSIVAQNDIDAETRAHGFMFSCENGRLKIAQWLVSLGDMCQVPLPSSVPVNF